MTREEKRVGTREEKKVGGSAGFLEEKRVVDSVEGLGVVDSVVTREEKKEEDSGAVDSVAGDLAATREVDSGAVVIL